MQNACKKRSNACKTNTLNRIATHLSRLGSIDEPEGFLIKVAS